MRKLKPLSAAERRVIEKLAAVFVCAELETSVIAPLLEKETGKPYDHKSSNSYLNTFLGSSPDCRRLWSLMQKDIASTRKNFAAKMRAERDE